LTVLVIVFAAALIYHVSKKKRESGGLEKSNRDVPAFDDALHGPYDLSAGVGFTGQIDHFAVEQTSGRRRNRRSTI
jgi:hypothetical protein